MVRLTRALAFGSAAAAAVTVAQDVDARRSAVQTATIGLVGSACRAFVRGANRLELHDAHHLHASLQRPEGTALLSVSNHIATIDDPHLLASIVPFRTLMRGGSDMRWGACGDDVCFRPRTMLRHFADAAKVLPVRRGAGVWQPELDIIISKLRAGAWVHYFPVIAPPKPVPTTVPLRSLVRNSSRRRLTGVTPVVPQEGKIRQDNRVHPFRRGVGRLVASVDPPQHLEVLPFYHTGCDQVQPTTPTSTKVFSWPSLGTDIHVIFGQPVDLSHLLALRDSPPFDKHPELLYEVIAHTLEEEVRALRAKLHQRLGVCPHIPREGGSFDNGDAAIRHPDA